jgi:WD40 repeat protein
MYTLPLLLLSLFLRPSPLCPFSSPLPLQVISSSFDGTIILWDIQTKKAIFERKFPLMIYEIIPSLSHATKEIPLLPNELIFVVKKSGTIK